MRVLLVDDNDDDRRWIERLLDEAAFTQHTISETDCVADALRLIENDTFDLCIVDWELPDGTGIELAQHDVVTAKHLPVIVITGNERPQQGAFAVGHGAADFLPKDDLTPKTLARACSHALARNELEREIVMLRSAELAATQREHEARLAAEASLVEERRARERVTALHGLSSMLGAATTTRDIIAVVVQRIAVLEPAAAVSVHLLKDHGLELEGASGLSERTLAQLHSLPLTAASPLTQAVHTSLAQRIDDTSHAGRHGVAVPLTTSSAAFGVLSVFFSETALPAPDALAYIELVAQHIAEALQRARLYEEAQQAAQFEERLLTVVGHDLRTPLSAIVMVAQLLKARGVESTLVARLERSGKRMNELISDVLDRAAVRRGIGRRHMLDATDLEALMQDQVDELRAALPDTQIHLELHGPVALQCEPSRTSQIISNLVRNAVQHGSSEGVVTVSLLPHERGAEISVHNLGAAIPAEDVPHLFDPFKRGRQAGGIGTGLGLFIVHESAAALGGEVYVRSGPDGTTFSVTLPNWPEAAEAESQPESNHS